MAIGDAHVFPGFLTTVVIQLLFKSHQLLYSCASAEVTGIDMPERSACLKRVSNSQPQGHDSDELTTEPPGWGMTTDPPTFGLRR